MLRLEVRNAAVPIEKKPSWIKTRLRTGPEYTELKSLVRAEGLHTVCEEAGCPNIFECWEDREATFLIGGDQCTRRCDFCQIDTGKPAAARPDEPRRVAESVQRWACATRRSPAWPATTSTTRVPGCTPRPSAQIHAAIPGCGVELLTPDFSGDPDLLAPGVRRRARGLRAQPRDGAADLPADPARLPLRALARGPREAHEAGLVTKSNLILGLGETRDEVAHALAGPARRRLRPRHDHPVPASVAAAPPGRALGQAGGVRRAARRGAGDRLRRRHVRPAGALLVPGRSALRRRPSRRADGRPAASRSLARPTTRSAGRERTHRPPRQGCATGQPRGRRMRPVRFAAEGWLQVVDKFAPRPANAGRLTQSDGRSPCHQATRGAADRLASASATPRSSSSSGWSPRCPRRHPARRDGRRADVVIIFGQSPEAQYEMIEGQPGAAAAIMENMRGGWTVTPAVHGQPQLDVVHRVGRAARASCSSARASPAGSGR